MQGVGYQSLEVLSRFKNKLHLLGIPQQAGAARLVRESLNGSEVQKSIEIIQLNTRGCPGSGWRARLVRSSAARPSS